MKLSLPAVPPAAVAPLVRQALADLKSAQVEAGPARSVVTAPLTVTVDAPATLQVSWPGATPPRAGDTHENAQSAAAYWRAVLATTPSAVDARAPAPRNTADDAARLLRAVVEAALVAEQRAAEMEQKKKYGKEKTSEM